VVRRDVSLGRFQLLFSLLKHLCEERGWVWDPPFVTVFEGWEMEKIIDKIPV
jgi:hypothetical protein